jgi:hypothetical protein
MQRKNSSSNLKADPSRVLHALAALPALKYMPHEAHVELSKKFSKKTFVKGGLPVGVASFGWLYISLQRSCMRYCGVEGEGEGKVCGGGGGV